MFVGRLDRFAWAQYVWLGRAEAVLILALILPSCSIVRVRFCCTAAAASAASAMPWCLGSYISLRAEM